MRKQTELDFLTLFPYIGIILLVIINAFLVFRQDVSIEDSEGH